MLKIPKLRSGLVNNEDPALYAEGTSGCEYVVPENKLKNAMIEAIEEALTGFSHDIEISDKDFRIKIAIPHEAGD